jgi:hypothetical protein
LVAIVNFGVAVIDDCSCSVIVWVIEKLICGGIMIAGEEGGGLRE